MLWASSPSPAQAATLPAQSLQLQLLAKCPRGTSRTTSNNEEKVYWEYLDGKTGPREGSKLESKKETANFWLAGTEALLSGGFSGPQNKESGVASLFLNLLALSLGCGLCMHTHTRAHSRSALGACTSHLLLPRRA